MLHYQNYKTSKAQNKKNKPEAKQNKNKIVLRPADKSINNFLQKISRLYEQAASLKRIWEYIERWLMWIYSGIQSIFILDESI